MKIAAPQFVRISLVARTALAAALLTALASHAQAQAPAPAAPAPVDYSKVEMKTTQLAPNFYTLEGSGGTIGVLVGSDGILMVDDEFAPLSGKIAAAIRKVSSAPIRFLINTHVHGDHTGGNENFGKMGVTIFAREELRQRLMYPIPAANGTPGTPAPAAALPVVTYTGRLTFHLDGENVEAIPIPVAHTDGDTMVFFHNDDIIMTGDFFRSLGYPNIDRANGGSLKGMLDGLGVLIGMMGPNTKAVPGHGVVVDRAAIIAHRDMIMTIRDRVAQMVQQGKTLDEVLAAHPTAEFDGKVTGVGTTADRFVGQLYAELKSAK